MSQYKRRFSCKRVVELLSRPDCEYLTVRCVLRVVRQDVADFNQPRIPTPDFRENSELPHGSVLAGLAPGAFSFGIPGLSVGVFWGL